MTVSNGAGKDAALVSTPGPGPRKIRPASAKARYYRASALLGLAAAASRVGGYRVNGVFMEWNTARAMAAGAIDDEIADVLLAWRGLACRSRQLRPRRSRGSGQTPRW